MASGRWEPRPWHPRRAWVIEQWKAGVKASVLARDVEVNIRTVHKWLRAAGLEPLVVWRAQQKEQRDAIEADLRAGVKVAQVAARFTLSESRIREFASQVGVSVGKRRRGSKSAIYNADPNDIGRMYWEELLTPAEIATKFGCHRHTVLEFMRRHGIPTRDARRSPAEAMLRHRARRTSGRASLTVTGA